MAAIKKARLNHKMFERSSCTLRIGVLEFNGWTTLSVQQSIAVTQEPDGNGGIAGDVLGAQTITGSITIHADQRTEFEAAVRAGGAPAMAASGSTRLRDAYTYATLTEREDVRIETYALAFRISGRSKSIAVGQANSVEYPLVFGIFDSPTGGL